MIENLKNINDRNTKLDKMSSKEIANMYLMVFNSPDGEMVMADLANRASVYDTTTQGVDCANYQREGMRALWLSIQTNLQLAVMPEIKED